MGKHFVANDCTDLGPGLCTVDNTIYGYQPSVALNAFFVATFAILVIPQLGLGFWKKQWFYSIAIACGCIGEAIGYGGRIMMHDNPYDDTAFTIQISCLIFSPAFIAAGIYLVLKHIINAFGPERSLINPRWITWIFITCDIISILAQAIGGGMAGGAGDNVKTRDNGTDLMIAGIVWQVATLLAFAGLAAHYALRTSQSWGVVPTAAKDLYAKMSFKGFLLACILAFTTIFVRCVYRIAEMVGGWANPIMRNELEFAILEGAMILVAAIVLTVFHPALCFPRTTPLVVKSMSPIMGSRSGSDSDLNGAGANLQTADQTHAQSQAEKGVAVPNPRFLRVGRGTNY